MRAPALVTHSRGDARVPFDEGRNHVLLERRSCVPAFMAEVRDFLGAAPAAAMHIAHSATTESALTAAERDVLRLVAQVLDNGAITRQLQKSEKTVQNDVVAIV